VKNGKGRNGKKVKFVTPPDDELREIAGGTRDDLRGGVE
jgi:hypothetical protein